MDQQLGLFPADALPPPPPSVGPATVPAPVRALAARLPRALRLGTSSWSFPGWAGIVYDRTASPAVLAREGLAAYAEHPLLRTVGLDRTYYRSITADDYRGYADAVPPDFRFLVKADRLLTSPVDPEQYGVRTPNALFLDPTYAAEEVVGPLVEGLGSTAGPVLFQFSPLPPNLVGGRSRFLDRLGRFLGALPEGPLYAVELRTPALLIDGYRDVLEATGAVHCYNVHPAMTPLDRQLELLQPYGQRTLVVRWMLHGGLKYEAARDRYDPFDALVDEDPTSRERIAVAVLDALIAEREVFVVANNKAEGSAPLTVRRLAERLAEWSEAVAPEPSPEGRPTPDALRAVARRARTTADRDPDDAS